MLAIIVLIILVMGLYSTNWYSLDETVFGSAVTMDFGLYEVESSSGVATIVIEYDDIDSGSVESSDIVDVATLTRNILIFGLIFLVIFMIMALVGALGKAGDFLRRATPIVGYLAGLIILVGAIYFAVVFPDAVEEDGGQAESESLGTAWTVTLLGSLLLLVGAEITRRAPSEYDYYEPSPYYPET